MPAKRKRGKGAPEAADAASSPGAHTATVLPPQAKIQRLDDFPEAVLRSDVSCVTVAEDLCVDVALRCRRDRLSSTELEQQEALRQRLCRVAAKWVHKGEAVLYGSRRSHIGSTAADDVDVAILWPGFDAARTVDETAEAKKLKRLCLSLHSKGFLNPRVVPSAKVGHVVQCNDGVSGARVDITVGNTHGVANTLLFDALRTHLPELSPAMWLLKRVGRARRFLNPAGRFLSSYCLLTMLVAAAQGAGLLPRLPSRCSQELTPEGVAARLAAHGLAPRAETSPGVLGTLLAAFLSAFHTDGPVAACVTEEGVRGAAAVEEAASASAAGVYVADVLNGTNCAGTLTPHHWLVCVEELGRLVDLARNGDNVDTWLCEKSGDDTKLSRRARKRSMQTSS
eukprot:Rhum_TRINITY_DN12357_c0_g2::Rhum_TRINITY_DN12357_c0_g2_i1::g.51249::m.51249